MFVLKNHNYLQIHWKIQKKFKYNFLQKITISNNIYKKLFFLKKQFLVLTRITILTKCMIKIDYLYCYILKFKKKKLSLILEEIINKFIINLNLKTLNFVI